MGGFRQLIGPGVVFTCHRGRAWRGDQSLREQNPKTIPVGSRNSYFDKVAIANSLEGLTPLDLRRTYASLSIQAAVSPKALQEAMGHSDIRLTMDVYASLFEEDKDDQATRLSVTAKRAFSEKCSQNVRMSTENKPNTWSRLGDSNSEPTHYERRVISSGMFNFVSIDERRGRPEIPSLGAVSRSYLGWDMRADSEIGCCA